MKYFGIILFLIISNCFSQNRTTIDTVRYRFSYAIKGNLAEESKRPYDDELSVDVGDSVTYCYSRWQDDNDKLSDKIRKSGGSANDFLAQQGPISLYDEEDIKHYPAKSKESIITFLYSYFLYEENMPSFNWNLIPGDSLILEYPCKRASCTYHGRTWNVWYSMTIPISEGPWKLQGLPGMILYAKDAKNQFSFECIGVKSNLNVPMTVNFKRTIKSTPTKVQVLQKLQESNYDAYAKAVGIHGIHFGFKSKPRTACLKEYY